MKDCGVVYIAFGKKAQRYVGESLESLRRFMPDIPACVVGDCEVEGTTLIPWDGPDPFDRDGLTNFKFMAGRIKPALYDLSPFTSTLYVDADTEFVADPSPGFRLLARWDMAVAMHPNQNLAQLYNKPLAAWFHNMRERDATIAEWNDGDVPYWNSGVIFWRRRAAVARVFAAWAEEWEKWQQWDEQQALMRAVQKNPLRVCVLPVGWNSPHRKMAKIIFHNYGRGVVRTND